MYTKKNTRVTFRSNRRPTFKRNNNFSNGKSRNKGNVTQQYNKYLKLAKESSSSGDRIQSEYYYQFTDHYYRLMLELGINLDENENENESENENEDNKNSIEGSDENQVNEIVEKKETIIKLSTKDEDISSIESIPFISKPVKKKIAKTKKIPI